MTPLLLNETCIAAFTIGYSNSTQLSHDTVRQCTYNMPQCISKSERNAKMALAAVSAFIFTVCLCMDSSRNYAKRMRRLRELPSHTLHEELEKEYKRNVLTKKTQREFDRKGPRYLSVGFVDDPVAKRRTVTIVEDLTKAPGVNDVASNNRSSTNYGNEQGYNMADMGRAGYSNGGGRHTGQTAGTAELAGETRWVVYFPTVPQPVPTATRWGARHTEDYETQGRVSPPAYVP